MTESDLLQILARGEGSRHQFKRDVTNADSLAAELVALANSGGGQVFLGVTDDGSVQGLAAPQVIPQVTGQVQRLLSVMTAEHSRSELQALLGLKQRDSFIALTSSLRWLGAGLR